MLDFQKLIPQIVALGEDFEPESDLEAKILSLAQTSFEEASANQKRFLEILKANGSNAFWPLAQPLEDISQTELVETLTGEHSVVACDGSQIMPTQHEIHSCYLLNIGSAVLHYSQNSSAQLSSFPYLYHKHEEIYPLLNQRRIHIDESLLSFERNLKEMETALELAREQQQLGREVLTLIDGSLIPFSVNRNADKIQNELIERYGICLDAFNAARLPLLGYISHSRSSDIVNALRIWRCPFPESRCQMNCGQLCEDEFPCSEIWPLSDRQLMSSLMAPSHRSAFFLSGTRWSTALQTRNWICFCYFNTGQEASRIEIPYWLFEEKELLKNSLSALLSQVHKGQGYPVALAEAHNMAVVRNFDRQRLFQLIAEQLMQKKHKRVQTSPKEQRKRRGII